MIYSSSAAAAYFKYVSAILLAILCGAALYSASSTYQRNHLYLVGEAPMKIHTSHGIYIVTSEDVTTTYGTSVRAPYRWFLVSLAAAAIRAKKEPILGLTGTDPGNLEHAVQALATLQDSLIAHQVTSYDRALVHQLFPTAFLASLVRTEEARRTFVAEPSLDTFGTYNRLLRKSLAQYQSSLLRFNHAFIATVPPSPRKFAASSVLLSYDTLVRTQHNLAHRAATLSTIVRADWWCTWTLLCIPPALSLQVPETPIQHAISIKERERFDLVRSIYASAHGEARGASLRTQIFALSESLCVPPAGDRPPYFIATKDSGVPSSLSSIRSISVLYGGNMRFIDATTKEENIPFASHVYGQDIAYIPVSEVTYYECPFVGVDQARVHVLASLSDYVRHSPFSLVTANAVAAETFRRIEKKWSENTIQEADAVTYLTTALAYQHTLPPQTREAADLFWDAYRHRSNNLEDIIGDMVMVTERMMHWADQNNVPFDLTPPNLFMLRSGFTNLYLGHHAQMEGAIESTPRPGNLREPFVYLSTITPNIISIEKLTKDTARYYATSSPSF